MSKKIVKINNVKHKYLNDLGIRSDECCVFNSADKEDDRIERFKAQRKKYGFDEREVWALDYTLAGWLYSHLKMFLDTAQDKVDLEYHQFDVPVLFEIPTDMRVYIEDSKVPEKYFDTVYKTVTQLEAIELVIKYLEAYLKNDGKAPITDEEQMAYEKAQCALHIVAIILPSLWW